MFFEGHCHTCNSDGFRKPDALLDEAYKEGIRGLMVTDHNTFTYERAFYYNEMLVLPAAELSAVYTVPETGERKEIHVIAAFGKTVPDGVKRILPDPDQSAYHKAIIRKLAELGIVISLKDVYETQRGCRHIGRPQIADALVSKGYGNSRDDVMDRLIGNNSPYFVPVLDYVSYPELDKVVRTVTENGGIAIMAHPYAYMPEAKMVGLIRYYASLAAPYRLGMEVYYSKYDSRQVKVLETLAHENCLLCSAGSDSHEKSRPLWKGDYKLFEKIKDRLYGNAERKGESQSI